MSDNLQILVFVILGVVLVWLGYSVLMGQWMKVRRGLKAKPAAAPRRGDAEADDPRTCPVCRTKLPEGGTVHTKAYPSLNGGRDRLMHIEGCTRCLRGGYERNCPVCRAVLAPGEKLVARMFSRTMRRNHVHVIGCSRCKPG